MLACMTYAVTVPPSNASWTRSRRGSNNQVTTDDSAIRGSTTAPVSPPCCSLLFAGAVRLQIRQQVADLLVG